MKRGPWSYHGPSQIPNWHPDGLVDLDFCLGVGLVGLKVWKGEAGRIHPPPSALRRNAPQSTNILCNSVQNYRMTTKFLNPQLDRRSLPALYYPGEGCRISHRKFWNVSFATSVIVLDTGHRSCVKSRSEEPNRTRSRASASLKTLNSNFARS